jgi:hypothetical protein
VDTFDDQSIHEHKKKTDLIEYKFKQYWYGRADAKMNRAPKFLYDMDYMKGYKTINPSGVPHGANDV